MKMYVNIVSHENEPEIISKNSVQSEKGDEIGLNFLLVLCFLYTCLIINF